MLVKLLSRAPVYVTMKQAANVLESLARQLALSMEAQVTLDLPNRPSVVLKPKEAAKIIADLARQLTHELHSNQPAPGGPLVDKSFIKKALRLAYPGLKEKSVANRAGKLWNAICRIIDNNLYHQSFTSQEIIDLERVFLTMYHKGVADGTKADFQVLLESILQPSTPQG